jgi:hypothetical protein
MKNCKVCNNEFQERSQGTEQLYCSTTCRALASKKRQEQKIIDNAKEEVKKKIENIDNVLDNDDVKQSSKYAESMGRIQRDEVSFRNNGGATSDYYGKDYIEKYYEARIENNALILKNQYLEDKVKQLEKDVFDLNSEIDVLENPKEEDNMLGSITQQFIKNPMETAKFVSAMFETFKTKK